MPVPAEIEEDRPLLSFFLGAQRFANGSGDGVVRFRRRNDTFGARKLNPGGKRVQLLHRDGLHQSQIHHVRYQRSHAVIAQSAGVNPRRNERAAQRVHLDQRRQVSGVAEIVGESVPWSGWDKPPARPQPRAHRFDP